MPGEKPSTQFEITQPTFDRRSRSRAWFMTNVAGCTTQGIPGRSTIQVFYPIKKNLTSVDKQEQVLFFGQAVN